MELPLTPHAVDHRLLSSDPAGLYIHVPFCQRKCPYCDFYSLDEPTDTTSFLNALKQEMSHAEEMFPGDYDSIYVGGGTPTILPGHQIAEIIRTALKLFRIASDAEITIEANPGTVSREKLETCLNAGINRLNIGVQSFQKNHLAFLGRIHSSEDAERAILNARQTGFQKIGIDLMFGLPGQSLESWQANLEQALAYTPEHLSCYSLTIEPGTGLFRSLQDRRFQPMPDSQVAELFEMTSEYLTENGYEHYEISNFCRGPENRSRHNRKYWRLAPYIGLGPSSHSFVYPLRWWNHRDVAAYLDAVSSGNRLLAGQEELSRSQSMMEMIYLGLRDVDGISYSRWEQVFALRFQNVFEHLLSDLVEKNMIESDNDRCRLTRSGMVFLDSIAQRFVEEL